MINTLEKNKEEREVGSVGDRWTCAAIFKRVTKEDVAAMAKFRQ